MRESCDSCRVLERQVASHAAFARVARSVAAGASPVDVLHGVAREAATLLGMEVGSIARFGDDEVWIMAGWTRPGVGLRADPGVGRVPLGPEGLLGRIARTGAAARIDDYADVQGAVAEIVRPFDIRSSVGAPVRVHGELWGAVIALSPRPAAAAPDAEERLSRFADLVDLSLGAAAHRAELESLAATDPLTGLANRRAFSGRLRAELERGRRHGRPVALVMLDLDHFKAVNDRHGHGVGDRVLVALADRLRREARPGDLLARIGGEEFAWILPEADASAAWTAAERARDAVARTPFPGAGSLTISAGVADTRDAADAELLYGLADRALYAAKAHGRDACFRYAPGVEAAPTTDAAAGVRAQTLFAIRALARDVDMRHPTTRGHSARVAATVGRLAVEMGWAPADAAALREAALVHDVGKIGVDPSMLDAAGARGVTPGPSGHTVVGAHMLAGVLSPVQVAWVRGHHERWDGRGGPDGLAGEAIPEGARLLAVAERWDALLHGRPGEPPRDPDAALAALRADAGAALWPRAVDAMARVREPAAAPGSAGG